MRGLPGPSGCAQSDRPGNPKVAPEARRYIALSKRSKVPLAFCFMLKTRSRMLNVDDLPAHALGKTPKNCATEFKSRHAMLLCGRAAAAAPPDAHAPRYGQTRQKVLLDPPPGWPEFCRNVAQCSPKFGRVCAELPDSGPHLDEPGRIRAKFGRTLAKVHRFRPEFG